MVCTTQKEITQSTGNCNDTFIVGCTNYRLSSLRNHCKSESHQRAVREEEHNKALKEGIRVPPCKVVNNVSADSAISMGLENMSEKEMQTVEKLHEIAFYIAFKGHPFTDFQEQIKLEKLHGVKYNGAYENKSDCRDFAFRISVIFEHNVKRKLATINFLAVLCDGSTDKSVMGTGSCLCCFCSSRNRKAHSCIFQSCCTIRKSRCTWKGTPLNLLLRRLFFFC